MKNRTYDVAVFLTAVVVIALLFFAVTARGAEIGGTSIKGGFTIDLDLSRLLSRAVASVMYHERNECSIYVVGYTFHSREPFEAFEYDGRRYITDADRSAHFVAPRKRSKLRVDGYDLEIDESTMDQFSFAHVQLKDLPLPRVVPRR